MLINNCNTQGMKVLIVDDTKENIDVLRKTLSPKKYDISIAQSGEQALKIVEAFNPDLILLDIMMPGINGFETCKKIKKIEALRNKPVIFISAKNETEDIVQGFTVGGVDYISKPFHQDEVILRVETQLNLVQLLKENEDLIKKLAVAAKTDYLTGLSNRREAEERISSEIKRFDRNQKEFSILISDIDHFKKINDQFGHDGGDFILKRVSQLLRESVRDHDVVARWGGEEFLILLPEADLKDSTIVGEKLRAMIEKEKFVFSGEEINLTMSFGVSSYNIKVQDAEKLIKIADECLYQAKNSGRNQIVQPNFEARVMN